MLGNFEEAVLMALLRVKGRATIADVYDALAGHKMPRSFGAIYTVRVCARGYLMLAVGRSVEQHRTSVSGMIVYGHSRMRPR
jgi:hypothetical protein